MTDKAHSLQRKCSRCDGTGWTDFRPMNGRCYKCGGDGKVPTAEGERVIADYLAEHTISPAELNAGDVLLIGGQRYTLETVKRIPYSGLVRSRKGETVTVVTFDRPEQNQAFEETSKLIRL